MKTVKRSLLSYVEHFEKQYPPGTENQIFRRMLVCSSFVYLVIYSPLAIWGLLVLAIVMLFSAFTASLFCLALLFPGMLLMVAIARVSHFAASSITADDDPSATQVYRDQVPDLFQVVDEVRQGFPGLKVHELWIVSELNAGAGVVRRRRHWYCRRNVIRLGMLMLNCVTQEELRSTIAHEMSHLSNRLNQRCRFVLFANALAWQARHLDLLAYLHPVLRSLNKQLSAMQITLGRRMEFAADRAAVRVCDSKFERRALARVSALVEDARFSWPRYESGYQVSSREPPREYLQSHWRYLNAALEDSHRLKRSLETALNSVESKLEYHPDLLQRILAIDESTSIAVNSPMFKDLAKAEPRGLALLGEQLAELTEQINEREFRSQRKEWTANYEYVVALSKAYPLARFEDPSEVQEFEEAWFRAKVAAANDRDEAAEPWLRRALELKPGYEPAGLWLAQIGLKKQEKVAGDRAGQDEVLDQEVEVVEVEQLEELIDSANSIVANEAILTLRRHYARSGNREKLDRIDSRWDRVEQMMIDTYREQWRKGSAEFKAAELEPVILAQFQAALASQPSISSAHCVRKKLKSCSGTMVYEIALTYRSWKAAWFGRSAVEVLGKEFSKRLSPIDASFVIRVSKKDRMKISAVEGAEIFCRAKLSSKQGDDVMVATVS